MCPNCRRGIDRETGDVCKACGGTGLAEQTTPEVEVSEPTETSPKKKHADKEGKHKKHK